MIEQMVERLTNRPIDADIFDASRKPAAFFTMYFTRFLAVCKRLHQELSAFITAAGQFSLSRTEVRLAS